MGTAHDAHGRGALPGRPFHLVFHFPTRFLPLPGLSSCIPACSGMLWRFLSYAGKPPLILTSFLLCLLVCHFSLSLSCAETSSHAW